MSSSAVSCCTCCPKASYGSATLVFSPTGDAPASCRFVFNCSARPKNRKPNQTSHPPAIRMNFGAAPSVVARWWSSKSSRPSRSNFVRHRWPPLLHDTTFSISNSLRVSACSVPVCLLAEPISSRSFLSAVSAILLRGNELPLSSVLLHRTASATHHAALSCHPIPIGPASAAGRLRSNGLVGNFRVHGICAQISVSIQGFRSESGNKRGTDWEQNTEEHPQMTGITGYVTR